MNYFDRYTSNTLAGSSNQTFFISEDKDTIKTARVYFKIFSPGEYNYSFLFSNITDTTFNIETHCNYVCDSWKICDLKVGICNECYADKATEPCEAMKTVTFNGETKKEVMPGEMFASDEVKLCFSEGSYLCLEISWKGHIVPCQKEKLIPVFALENGQWVKTNIIPAVNMVGCDRKVKSKIAFLGDSITQGLGTQENLYEHWNVSLAEKLGRDNAYWNLGVGFARASDAASDGNWLFKAKQNDVVIVCLGVNDIKSGRSADEIVDDICKTILILKEAGIKVILQTIPPFDYNAKQTVVWERVNCAIKNTFCNYVEMVFDNVSVLCRSEKERNKSRFGGHPNGEGCKRWTDALYSNIIKNNFEM